MCYDGTAWLPFLCGFLLATLMALLPMVVVVLLWMRAEARNALDRLENLVKEDDESASRWTGMKRQKGPLPVSSGPLFNGESINLQGSIASEFLPAHPIGHPGRLDARLDSGKSIFPATIPRRRLPHPGRCASCH